MPIGNTLFEDWYPGHHKIQSCNASPKNEDKLSPMNSSAHFQSKPNLIHSPESFGAVYDLSSSLSLNRANEVGSTEMTENRNFNENSQSPIVCRFYLAGGCISKNCGFKHTISKADQPCRYHKTSFCIRGPHCHFRHDAPAPPKTFVEDYTPNTALKPVSNLVPTPNQHASSPLLIDMQDTKYNPVYPPISETPYINQHIGSLSAPFNKESATSDSALTSEEPKRRNFLKVLVPEHNNACGGPPGSFNREGNFYVDDFPPLPGGSESGGCELLLKAVSAGAGSWERNGGAVRVLGAAGKREDHGFEAAEKAYGVCEGEWYAGEEEWSDNGLGFGEEYMPPLEKVLRARLKDLKNEYFPHVPKEEIEKTFNTVGKNPIHTIVLLGKKFGLPKPKVGSGLTLNSSFSNKNNYHNENNNKGNALTKQEVIHKGRSEKWVETGDPLDSMYSDNRAKAIDHAQKRNRLLCRANEAFRKGDRAVSREMSQKAKFHDAEMRRLHALARENIFKERNRDFGKGETKRTIDLHGLHRLEAVDMLTEC